MIYFKFRECFASSLAALKPGGSSFSWGVKHTRYEAVRQQKKKPSLRALI